MPGLESLLSRLIQARVDFVIVGGFAAMAHGVTLVTQDIDICLRFSPDNLFRLRDSLVDLKAVHRMTPQRIPLDLNETNVSEFKNLYLDTDYGQLDCLSELKGIGGFDAVAALSEQVELTAGRCRVLGIDGLIRAKEAMGRVQDRLAILQLRAIQEREVGES